MSESFDDPVIMEIPMDIPESLYKLNDVMANAGFEVYIAGGAVRDTILGKTPKDYDISTNASVQDVIKFLSPYVKFAGIQGEKSFEVARLIAYDGNEYEFAPYRVDTGTRKGGEATPAASIEEDVKRRDLTINALFYRIPSLAERREGVVGEVVDYVGGIDDIKNEIIRTVGDPERRFGEDRLRILRAFRFAGRVGGEIDSKAAKAIMENNSLTEPSDAAVSDERIALEVIKGVVSAKIPSHYINMLIDFHLFPQILPGLKVSKAISPSNNIVVQFATILLENNSNDAARVIFDKRFGNDIKESVGFLLDLFNLDANNLMDLKKEYKRIIGSSNKVLNDKAIMDFGIVLGQNFDKFLKFANSPPVVSARDLIAGGMKPGPGIGAAIREAEIESYFGSNLDESNIVSEGKVLSDFVKIAQVENPLNISIPQLSGVVYVFDMDDTLFWAPEWHTIIETDEDGDATSVNMDYPNMFHKAISFVEKANENHAEIIKKDKKGRQQPNLISSYKQEVGKLRLIKNIVDIPVLGKERQVVFVLSDESGNPMNIPTLKKYFSSKYLKPFDLRGKYVEGQAVVAGDAVFYQSPKTLGVIPNAEILDTYKAHSSNAVILTAREAMEGMEEGIRERLATAGLKIPISIFTKPTNLSSGKYKAHVIGQIAQQDAVTGIEFYDDNLKYITDVNNILENVYGPDIHSLVNIHLVSIKNKPEDALSIEISKESGMFKKLVKIANELDRRGLIEEASHLDGIISFNIWR